MITEIFDFIQFGPHEVPFVAPLMSMGALAFIFILWLIKEIEEDQKEAETRNIQDITDSRK